MNRLLVMTASVIIALAIISGALAAHGLKDVISAALQENWQTAARYQIYGGLGLLAVALASDKFGFSLKWFTILLLTGILLFSGSLYFYCLNEFAPALKFFARIVPVGGFLMIAAWCVLAIQVWRSR